MSAKDVDPLMEESKSRKHIAKWGFGMAPISANMRKRYDEAALSVTDFIIGNISILDLAADNISELKGMFNRCVREDQWDWFSVHAEFGHPSKSEMRAIVQGLKVLRVQVLNFNEADSVQTVQQLVKNGLLTCLMTYQGEHDHGSQGDSHGWVYILSTRESPNILKIGMTSRSVSQRVKEINSATGILHPLSARAVYRVRNPQAAESELFKLLANYRIRQDREFFEIPFQEATKLVRAYISKERLSYMRTGKVVWYDDKNQFGFIDDGSDQNVFLHASQIDKRHVNALQPGAEIEYSLLIRPQGKFAIDVRPSNKLLNNLLFIE
jgi:cold shock CspA family protein